MSLDQQGKPVRCLVSDKELTRPSVCHCVILSIWNLLWQQWECGVQELHGVLIDSLIAPSCKVLIKPNTFHISPSTERNPP